LIPARAQGPQTSAAPKISGTLPSWTRSPAVDFFRGLGLWIVYLDHVEPNVWSNLTLWRFGFSDFAEIFIFLSGFIGFGSYERAIASGDSRAAIKKLVRRFARLYVAHIASFSVSLILVGVLAQRGLRLPDVSMYVWMQDPAKYLVRILTLTYAPNLFSLLPLYLILSPVLLLAAIGLKRAPRFTLCLSGALWLASQVHPWDARISSPNWVFHPLAWQFLFVLGAATRDRSDQLRSFALSKWTIGAAGAIVVGSAVLKGLTAFPAVVNRMSLHLLWDLHRNAGKGPLASYRLLHFLALLVLVHALTHDRVQWLRSLPAQLAIACGVDSLFVYSCSLVLATGANLILVSTHGGAVVQLELTIFGLAALTGLAWLRRGSSQFQSRPGYPASVH
jgi:hypothetical protein